MTTVTNIATYTQTSTSKGWSNNILLLSDLLNKNMKCVTIGVNIKILCIKFNESSSLYFNKTVNNINSINYKKKQSFKWHINNKLLSLWKQSRMGRQFESKIFDNQWVLTCNPQGQNKQSQGCVSIFLQICSLPPTVKQMTVKYEINCVETNHVWNHTTNFSYDHAGWGIIKPMKSTKMNKYSS
eukprot:6836_1